MPQELHFSIFITVLRAHFSSFLFLVGRGCHRSLQCLSFSVMTLQLHHRKRSFLDHSSRQRQHGLWWWHRSGTWTWPVEAAQAMDINKTCWGLAGHRHQHDLRKQYRPRSLSRRHNPENKRFFIPDILLLRSSMSGGRTCVNTTLPLALATYLSHAVPVAWLWGVWSASSLSCWLLHVPFTVELSAPPVTEQSRDEGQRQSQCQHYVLSLWLRGD